MSNQWIWAVHWNSWGIITKLVGCDEVLTLEPFHVVLSNEGVIHDALRPSFSSPVSLTGLSPQLHLGVRDSDPGFILLTRRISRRTSSLDSLWDRIHPSVVTNYLRFKATLTQTSGHILLEHKWVPFNFHPHKGAFSVPFEDIIEASALLNTDSVILDVINSTSKTTELISVVHKHTQVGSAILDFKRNLGFHLYRLVFNANDRSLHRLLELTQTSLSPVRLLVIRLPTSPRSRFLGCSGTHCSTRGPIWRCRPGFSWSIISCHIWN